MTLQVESLRGTTVPAALAQFRKENQGRGRQAFVVGNRRELSRLEEGVDDAMSRLAEILREAASFDVDSWLAERRRELEEDGRDLGDELLGDWPKDTEPQKLTTPTELLLVTVPVAHAWQIPAAVGYGGWNDCPDPIIQCAFAKRWSERYAGAIAMMSGDTIEWEVGKPPKTREEAEALAWEQYLFCGDIVDQGCNTIRVLADILRRSSFWFFWWD